MDFHIETWDEAFPSLSISWLDMETIAALYELRAMADGPK